ncbi:hypothetical protein DM02DRAFT_628427 [Periconia macrospinosa]|uniref:Uncharacterized protein n=1 Tax=Periconia macrospinosa TaxID=97972 RepID=A0A2V1DR57_9PLEO|nr:hypothetical protein DM02DRAFT_628427 [Periconia macrospinosa]
MLVHTEVEQNDDSNVSDAAEENIEHHRIPHPLRHTSFHFVAALLGGIAIVIWFLAASMLHPVSLPSLNSKGNGIASQLSDSVFAYVPEFPKHTKKFEFDTLFAGDPSKTVTAAWVSYQKYMRVKIS